MPHRSWKYTFTNKETWCSGSSDRLRDNSTPSCPCCFADVPGSPLLCQPFAGYPSPLPRCSCVPPLPLPHLPFPAPPSFHASSRGPGLGRAADSCRKHWINNPVEVALHMLFKCSPAGRRRLKHIAREELLQLDGRARLGRGN